MREVEISESFQCEHSTSYPSTNPVVSSSNDTNESAVPNVSSQSNIFSKLKYKLRKHKGLNIVHLNVRSLLPKMDEIIWMCDFLNLDVICISESWLNTNIANEDMTIEGYSSLRKDRTDKNGGGVVIYIKNTINFKNRPDINSDDMLEMIWIEIVTNGSDPNVLLSCTYRPPNANCEYVSALIDSFVKAESEDKEMVLLGDLNFDYSVDENMHNNPLFLIESMFSMTQLIQSPTRVTNTSSSLLDVILSTCPSTHTLSGV